MAPVVTTRVGFRGARTLVAGTQMRLTLIDRFLVIVHLDAVRVHPAGKRLSQHWGHSIRGNADQSGGWSLKVKNKVRNAAQWRQWRHSHTAPKRRGLHAIIIR